MKDKFKLLIDLYVTFMQIGAFTIGGGYAMIPIMQHQVVDNKKWISEEEMTTYLTLAQSAPGVIGVNTSTAVGYRVCGFWGGLAAVLGLVTPSIIIVTIIASFFASLMSFEQVHKAFAGVRSAVVALIFVAVIRLYKSSVKNKFQLMIFLSSISLSLIFDVSAIFIIIISGVIGVSYGVICSRKRRPRK